MNHEQEYQDCPYCPNQGWYVGYKSHPVYDDNGNLIDVEPIPVQVQCEFCWTNPLSKFHAPQVTA